MRFHGLSSPALFAACALGALTVQATPAPLAAPADFAGIADQSERSRAHFVEASKVLLHPRCTNCHPQDDRPRQRRGEAHVPLVERGAGGLGIAVLECQSCHQEKNAPLSRVPGAPGWRLAPRQMAWQGQSVEAICAQLKDPQRNGGRSLAQVVEHARDDRLVAWGWAPGVDREPAPGAQVAFAALLAQWVATGAVCPKGNK